MKRLAMGAVLAAGLGMSAGGATAETVLLGASKPGHSAYNIVVAYSQAITKSVPDLTTTVQASGGSVDAVQFLQAKRVHAAPVGALAPYQAYRGEEKWKGKPFEGVRTWLPMYSWAVQLVVPADSPIQSWSDLKGKRVGVGPVGSAGEKTNQEVLAAAGLTYDDIEEFRIPHGESVDGLKNGSLDAFIETTGYPTPGILEIMATMDVRIVPNSPEEIERAAAANDLYSAGTIPAAAYPQLDSDLPAVVGYTIMIVDESVPEDTVYKMTKAIWESLDDIKESHASQRHLSPEMIAPALEPVAPIHAGARKYYVEQGWIEDRTN